ncbi:MAG: hypothetical protein ABI904_03480 [Chloroflexota bacterium]
MPEFIHPSELEETLKDVSNVPEPDVEFMNSLRARFIAEGHASANKNQETQMRRKTFSQRLTWALAVLMLVTLIVLSTQPTVVNALKRLFGYVPNVGLIDQSSQVRMLVKPVTVTRENFTVTVEQAVLTHESTVIVYSYSTPPDFSPDPGLIDTRSPSVTLPDGTRLEIIQGQRVAAQDCSTCAMRYSMQFGAIPANVESASLQLPGLIGTPIGSTPQDWSIPLKFRLTGPSEIAPVIEYEVTPAPTETASPASTEPAINIPTQEVNTYGVTHGLDKVAQLPDGYILYGHVTWTDRSIRPYGVSANLSSIKDANGVDVSFDYAQIQSNAKPEDMRQDWAFKIGKDFVAPLKLDFYMEASLDVDGGSFTFDPGPAPKLGQKWVINQDVLVDNKIVHVLSVEQAGIEPGYFQFTMQSDSNIIDAFIIDPNYPPAGGGGGGGGMPQIGEPFFSGYGYQMPLPQGPRTMKFFSIGVLVPGDWALTWSP